MSADFWIKDGEWTDETVTISLAPEPGAKWADVRVEGETTAIKITSVDTGAGSVAMPAGEARWKGGAGGRGGGSTVPAVEIASYKG